MKLFNYRIYSTVFALCVAVSLMAQGQLQGTVMDDTGEPLIGANVIVQGTTDGTITDFDGSFSFSTSSSFPLVLEVSFTGYDSKEINLDAPSTDIAIELSAGVLLTEDVVISASRKREKVQEAPASISVINARKLTSTPQATDPLRNLVTTPGVQIQQQSAARINISMRGSAGLFGTSVFPILDYRNLSGVGTGTFQSDRAGLSNIDLQRIEVVRGPGSALYGPGVDQGVVHFISKSPIDFPGTTVEVIGGELATFGGSIRHAGTNANKTFGYKINVSHKQGDEFTLQPGNPIDDAQIAKFRNQVFAPLIGPDRFVVGQEDTPLIANLDEDGDGNPMSPDWRSTFANATLEFRPKDNLTINVAGGWNGGKSVFYNEQGEGLSQDNTIWTQARVQAGGLFAQVFYSDNDGGTRDNPTFLYQTGLQSSIARKQLEGQLQYNFAMPSFLDADWTVGFDYRGSQEDTGNRVYGRNELDDDFSVVGGYAQAKFALADKLDLVLAGRYDRFNFIDDGAFAPRAALVFKASPKHTFRGSFNRANTTVSNLQLNIDFPLSTIIPNSLDVWLYGNKVPQTFSSNPTYSWFTGLIPEVPVGTPGAGLPLGVITGFPVAPGATLNDAVAAGVAQGLAANPATAPFADQIAGLLLNLDQQALGFGGQLSPGFNIFDGSPLPIVDAPVSRISTRDVWEVGYKGLFGDKFGVSLDVYNVDNNNFSQFTAISPAYALVGADGIPGQLGTSVQGQVQPQIEALLLGAGLPAQVAGATAAQLGGLINGAYTAGAADFLNTPSDAFGGASLQQVIDGLPFHATTQTQQSPANGVTHVAAGYRTFDNINYWGADLGTEYYATDDLSLFFNYSWVSETEFMASVVDAEGVADLPFLLNIPANKYRLGFNYTPEYGFNANASFQHDPSFLTNSGQFSGLTDEKNLIDAGVGYKFDNGLSLEVTAQNLFDSQYRGYPNMPIIGRRVLGRLVYEFGAEGPSDMDGDGIADKKDACPNEPGIKAFNGCADTDGDGIPDKEDNCPMFAGDAINMGCPDTDGDGFIDIKDDCKDVAGDLNGCPDSDGDGVADKDDNCPNSAGTLAGCPDSDGDGVADKDDNCPETAGALAGCPDSDGDGVADKDDKCPNEAGTDYGCPADADGDGVTGDADKCPNEGGIVDENGCPKDSDGDGIADNDDKCPNIGGIVGPDGCAKAIPVKAAEVFTRAIAGINFRSGNAVLTRASYANLDEVVSVMTEFPGLQLSIEGHTDSQGKDDTNMQLSISRAQSVMKYLSDKGVDPTRMRAVGFGELVPIASNDTSEGRLQNRRVEFKASY